MEAIFIKCIMLSLGVLFIPIVAIICVSIISAICLSAAIYINVVITLIKDTAILSKHKGVTSIPNDIN